jgi:hypothetical protein
VVWTTRACCPPGHWLGPVTGLGRMSPTQPMRDGLDSALKREWVGSGL